MRLPTALRRSALVAVTSALFATVPFAAPALAHTITVLGSNAGSNDGVKSVTFTTAQAFLDVPEPPTVVFSRSADSTETVQATNVVVEGTTVQVNVDLTRRNPGAWNITVTGMVLGEIEEQQEDCHSCYTVTAFKPAVTSATPMTIGQGASGVAFEINGNNFTDSVYCNVAPCGALPTVAISGGGVNLSGSGTAGAEQNATLTKITKKIQVDGNATLGARDITVTNTDGKVSDACVGCLVVAPAPTLTAITPVGGLANGASNRTVVLTGTNFSPTATVAFSNDADATKNGVTISTTTVDSPTQITLTVSVNSSTTNAPTGARRITVTNPDFGSESRNDLFTVNAVPTVSGVDYVDNTGVGYGRGALNRAIEIAGTNFKTGATVTIANATGITLGTPVVNSATLITVPATLTQRGTGEPALGTHSITITNTDGGVSGSATNFTVTEGPRLDSVSPPARARSTSATLTLTGVNFDTANGVTVEIPDVTVTGTPTVNSATEVSVPVTAGTVVGAKNVVVTNNGDKGRYVCTGCFSVDNLQVDSITSPVIAENQSLTITGGGFAADAVATLVKTGTGAGSVPDVVGTSAVVNEAGTSLTATFALANAAPGAYLVRITNPTTNAGTGTCTCQLTVTAPAPSITGVNPDDRGEGADDETLTITGTNFAPGVTVTFSNSKVIVVPGSTVVSPTQITVKIDIGEGAFAEDDTPAVPAELKELYVTNTDGQLDNIAFTVNRPPTATSTDEPARARGTSDPITLTGDDILPGATLVVTGDGVTVVTTNLEDGNGVNTHDELTATVTVAADAPLGARTVYVRNPDGGRATCAGCTLTITDPPTIATVSPNKAARTAATTFTITGTGFASGLSVAAGPGVTVGTISGITATSFTVVLTPASDATLGLRDITVTNADEGSATKTDAFKVFTVPGAPTIGSATRGSGSGTANVTWTAPSTDGNDPITGYTVTSSPGGITKSVDASATEAVVTGLTNGTSYKFTVVATNPAGNGPASGESNAVVPATVPDAPTALNATAGNGEATVSWTAPAGNGGSPVLSYTVTSNPGGKTKTVDAPTTSATVAELTNGTAYTFTVVATNDVGDSAPSSASSSVTPSTVPNPPTDVSAAASDSSALVSWTAPLDNGGSPVTGYTVTSDPGGHTANAAGDAGSVNVPGLTNGTAYTFTVTATNVRGSSVASAPSAAVTPFTIPGAPTDVTATESAAAANVSWLAPSTTNGSAITGYTVTSNPGSHTAEVDGSTLTAKVTGLTPGTPYTFTVVATNAAGNSAPSAASNSVTPFDVPGAPTAVSAFRGDQAATVTWTAPASNGGSPLTGFTVTSDPGGITKTVDDGTATSTAVTGLTNGTSYTFTVVAKNAGGDSAPSAASNPVTPAGAPFAPPSVTATAGHAAATVSWTAPSGNGAAVTGYTVTASPGGAQKTLTGTSTTFTGLSNGVLYTFAVRAHNAVGSGPATTSNAVRPTWVTKLTEGATTFATAGGYARVFGRLTRSDGVGISGATIAVYRRTLPNTGYKFVRNVTTGTGGSWTTSLPISRNTYYAAKFLGTSGYDKASSPARFTYAKYKLSVTHSVSGRTLTSRGSVFPNAAGRSIYLQHRRSNGTYVTLRSGKVASNGTYRLVRSLPPGTYNLRVVIGSSSTNYTNATPIRSLRIT